MQTNSRRAFTLIELLVVVAIIAILMAILLPSLGSARQQAASVKCLSNLRATGQGVYIYANENNGFIPAMVDPDWSTTGYPAGTVSRPWFKVLSMYLSPETINDATLPNKLTKVLTSCPGWQIKTVWPNASIDEPSKPGYGYNGKPLLRAIDATGTAVENNLWGPFPIDNIPTADSDKTGMIKLLTLNPASDRVLFSDSVDYHVALSMNAGRFDFPPAAASGATPKPISLYSSGDPTRHGVKDTANSWANYSFADGHAESLKAETARRVLLQLPR